MLGAPEQRTIINNCLRGQSYRLVFATDGEDGFDRFREVQPDLVLTHLKTVRLDGTILCHLVMQESQGQVGVVLFGDEPIARGTSHAEAVGARAYLPMDQLEGKLAAVLARTLAEPPSPPKLEAAGPTAPHRVVNVSVDEDSFESIERGVDEIPTSTNHAAPELNEVLQQVKVETPRRETSSGLHHMMLEEPMLPGTSGGTPRPIAPSPPEATIATREQIDDLIEELPRELTPSHVSAAPPPGVGQRKGLDESQLGKRLVKRVQQVHEKLETLNYYQLLGVERTATPAQLRSAYFELSLEFHPDRFFLLRSGDIKAKIYAIFRRVSEAYAVLSDERRRAMYDESDATLERSLPPLVVAAAPSIPPPARTGVLDPRLSAPELKLDGVTANPAARRFMQLANVALKAEDLDGARLLLAFAVGLDPQSASLRRVLDGVAKRRSDAVVKRWRARDDLDATLNE